VKKSVHVALVVLVAYRALRKRKKSVVNARKRKKSVVNARKRNVNLAVLVASHVVANQNASLVILSHVVVCQSLVNAKSKQNNNVHVIRIIVSHFAVILKEYVMIINIKATCQIHICNIRNDLLKQNNKKIKQI